MFDPILYSVGGVEVESCHVLYSMDGKFVVLDLIMYILDR